MRKEKSTKREDVVALAKVTSQSFSNPLKNMRRLWKLEELHNSCCDLGWWEFEAFVGTRLFFYSETNKCQSIHINNR